MDLAHAGAGIGSELLGDGAGIFSRLREKLRPQIVELGDYVTRIGGVAFAVEHDARFQQLFSRAQRFLNLVDVGCAHGDGARYYISETIGPLLLAIFPSQFIDGLSRLAGDFAVFKSLFLQEGEDGVAVTLILA